MQLGLSLVQRESLAFGFCGWREATAEFSVEGGDSVVLGGLLFMCCFVFWGEGKGRKKREGGGRFEGRNVREKGRRNKLSSFEP